MPGGAEGEVEERRRWGGAWGGEVWQDTTRDGSGPGGDSEGGWLGCAAPQRVMLLAVEVGGCEVEGRSWLW